MTSITMLILTSLLFSVIPTSCVDIPFIRLYGQYLFLPLDMIILLLRSS